MFFLVPLESLFAFSLLAFRNSCQKVIFLIEKRSMNNIGLTWNAEKSCTRKDKIIQFILKWLSIKTAQPCKAGPFSTFPIIFIDIDLFSIKTTKPPSIVKKQIRFWFYMHAVTIQTRGRSFVLDYAESVIEIIFIYFEKKSSMSFHSILAGVKEQWIRYFFNSIIFKSATSELNFNNLINLVTVPFKNFENAFTNS